MIIPALTGIVIPHPFVKGVQYIPLIAAPIGCNENILGAVSRDTMYYNVGG